MDESSYQVILSTDGKHTVIATSNNIQLARAGLEWAKVTYENLVKQYGLKHQQYQKNGGADNGDSAPICALHGTPMVKQQGKYGEFWSCHERTADGSFCNYRPNGQ